MATRLSIWRGAFGEMTGGFIESTELTSDGAAADSSAGPIAAVYPSIVSAALTRIYWPWTLHRADLTAVTLTNHEFKYSFTMPATSGANVDQPRLSAGPLALYHPNDSKAEYRGEWKVEGNLIYADVNSLAMLYQRKTPEETWTEQFAEYVRLLLMASTVGTYGDTDLISYYRNLAEDMFAQAAGSTQEVDSLPKSLIAHFQTTSLRQSAGYGLSLPYGRA